MHVVTGATGRVGGATAAALLAAGAGVRVVVRDPARAPRWAARGAQVAVADLRDRAALAAALDGADGAFVLSPFDLDAADPLAHAAAVADSVAGAVADAGVPHVVALSSGGADLRAGTGPVLGLHRLEEALGGTGAVVTALRACHFQEKVGDVLDLAREQGVLPVLGGSADHARPQVATRDVGAVAARALLAPPARSEAVDVLGPAISEREVAEVLTRALRRPVQPVVVAEAAWVPALADAGLPPAAAELVAELYRADERGLLAPRGDRVVVGTTSPADTVAALGAVAAVA
ncbi:NmrA family NAD(P)-binding protein [Cellulomonas pakistanensis]|uniref:NmrA-like domain-containing protein n=1 Tax=Cellulomonas pakistanensis TaxID=992287 RepID=A0A919U7M5_9CELL|nr:NmrA family NAD(P)-binding protein [Cellulomonas pakistanensis]GIG37525.1 hypothetical protein Cpa01nite_29060 [Cellulomonas pakistanensis]